MLIHSIRPVLSTEFVVYTELRNLCRNHEPTLRMLSKFLYWAENVETKAPHRDGWFWKTGKDLANEIGITRRGYETARSFLTQLGILDFKKCGLFNKMHFRVNADTLLKLVYQIKGIPVPKDINACQLDNDGFRIPNWMPLKQWNQFIHMRQTKKGRVMLNIDKKKRINELNRFRSQKLDIEVIMQETIARGWAAFYPPGQTQFQTTAVPAVSKEEIIEAVKLDRQQHQSRPKPTFSTTQQSIKHIKSILKK